MYTVKLSPLAKEDLQKIKAYLIREFGEDKAQEILIEIFASLRKFEEFPLLGRPLTNVIDIPTDYMYFVIHMNYIFYRVEDKEVKIIRILDTRQDFMTILFK